MPQKAAFFLWDTGYMSYCGDQKYKLNLTVILKGHVLVENLYHVIKN